jgi:DNA adenine methylase
MDNHSDPPRDTPAKPFLKWAGGKSRILSEIRDKYPSVSGKNITKYAEPFVGGGAVLFDVLARYHLKEVYISDINSELILTYTVIRDRIEDLLETLKGVGETYLAAGDDIRKEPVKGSMR